MLTAYFFVREPWDAVSCSCPRPCSCFFFNFWLLFFLFLGRQEAQLPYVFLGSLTDRAFHWTPQLLYNYDVSTLSANKPCDKRGRWSFQTLYTFRSSVLVVSIIGKPLRAFIIIHVKSATHFKISERWWCIMRIITKFSGSTPVRRPLCSKPPPKFVQTSYALKW